MSVNRSIAYMAPIWFNESCSKATDSKIYHLHRSQLKAQLKIYTYLNPDEGIMSIINYPFVVMDLSPGDNLHFALKEELWFGKAGQ